MSWNFFVSHYDKYDPARGGMLCPRAATIGGLISEKAAGVILAHGQAETEETLVPASSSAPLQL